MTGQGGQTRAPTPPAADRWWLVLPAAGFGRRMCSDTPKQYMKIGGRSILDITLGRFAGLPGLAGVVLVAADDIPADAVDSAGRHGVPLLQVCGGATRAESVRNGLAVFRDRWAELAPDEPANAGLDEWAMIHDAARPCVRPEDIRALLAAARAPDGALLGARVRDTIKRVDHQGRVEATVDRRPLMHALTPQMFPVSVLLSALEQGLEAGREITDESSAVEQVGLSPRMVPAAADNLKITHPEDLAIARAILARQGVMND